MPRRFTAAFDPARGFQQPAGAHPLAFNSLCHWTLISLTIYTERYINRRETERCWLPLNAHLCRGFKTSGAKDDEEKRWPKKSRKYTSKQSTPTGIPVWCRSP